MTFTYDVVLRGVSQDPVSSAGEEFISLNVLDLPVGLGVGVGSDGSLVFVGPGQPAHTDLEGRRFLFRPWTDLVDEGSGQLLSDICILRLLPPTITPDYLNAVAAVFVGLIELAIADPRALGDAIAAMTGLFESGLLVQVPRDLEVGLAGELLVIAESAEPAAICSLWHTQTDARFDFSAPGERLDVKTTTGDERTHWFSSAQVAPLPGACITVCSVMLPVVEVGATVSTLFARLCSIVPDQATKIRRTIIETLGVPPEMVRSVVFDASAAALSVRHVHSSDVPTPIAPPGVLSMRWHADLTAATLATDCSLATLLGYP